MTKSECIRALNAAGYTLIPLCSSTDRHSHRGESCKTPGKVPIESDWRKTPQGKYNETNLHANYGVALHDDDLVVDVDPRRFPAGDRPLQRLARLVGGLNSFTVRTGGGGIHVYFKKPVDARVVGALKEYPGIEFKREGHQVVGPGSKHFSGGAYEIVTGDPSKIASAPAALLELARAQPVPDFGLGTGEYRDDPATAERYQEFLERVAEPSVQGQRGDENALRVAFHGRDLGLPPRRVWELMLSHWNGRCLPPWTEDELKGKVIHAFRYAQGAVGTKHPAADFQPVQGDRQSAGGVRAETADDRAVHPSSSGPGGTSVKELSWDTTAQGGVKKTFQNALNYLRMPSGGLHKVFAMNEFTGRVEFVRPAPWHEGRMPKTTTVGDEDLKLLKGYLAVRHQFEMPVQHLEEAVANIAYYDRFHPVREYLNGLKWDGKARLDFWLRDYLGVEDTDYTRACARKTLCAAVMRAFHPGVKFDHVLTLEGAQDIGKSTVVEILGGKWATDAPVDPHSRDTVDMMQGRWIIEFAELEVLHAKRVDEEALKAFITRRNDLARLAFGRMTKEFPRQSIFIATKNPRADGTYLKDETGNRRWWPVRCEPLHGLKQIDFAGLRAVRDQLFAEAVAKMKTPPGEKLFMETEELKQAAKTEVGKRLVEHEWTDAVAQWLYNLQAKSETRREFVTGREVFIEAMGGTERQFDRRAQTAIASVMRSLGWPVGFRRIHTRFTRVYIAPLIGVGLRYETDAQLLGALS